MPDPVGEEQAGYEVKKRESLDEIIETLDQMVEPDCLVPRLFFFLDASEVLERGLYDKAIKPGSIVVDGTDIVDDGGG